MWALLAWMRREFDAVFARNRRAGAAGSDDVSTETGLAAVAEGLSFSTTSLLNGASLQPGSSVQLAVQQLSQAQSLLAQQTQGNFLARLPRLCRKRLSCKRDRR